ncbi:MAG: helix-turn-helix domain-containing protein [Chitinophagales bacterium]|nr:helix-turn-helix domain-containing protein [Chitinophagales bacterium]
MADIPNSLKKYRRITGYTQKEVAKILEFKSTSRISRWEKGESMPSVKNLLKLSFLYATLPNDLYYDLWMEVRNNLRKKK